MTDVLMKVVHEVFHALDATDQVDNTIFFGLLIKSLDGIVDRFTQDGG